jgi:DnaJ-class molecular chaperone
MADDPSEPDRRGDGGPPPEELFAQFGDIFRDLFGAAGAGGTAHRGGDLELPLSVTLAEAVRGVERTISVPRWTACSFCKGEGGQPGATATPCDACAGRGQRVRTEGAFRMATPCDVCGGAGRRWSRPCPVCEGRCGSRATSSVRVTVPAGVQAGQKLRLRGQASPRADGTPGDLFLDVRIEPHATLTREGDDLVARVRVSPELAARGGELRVPWLDGEARVLVPPGTAHRDRLVRRGWGGVPLGQPYTPPPADDPSPYRAQEIAGRGDLVVVALVGESLDDALERELAATPDRPRPPGAGAREATSGASVDGYDAAAVRLGAVVVALVALAIGLVLVLGR